MSDPERPERAAGGDDRAFGSEWATGADCDRGGERLQECQPRGDSALMQEDTLHRFGDSVAADSG
jgi:hypothetical protein